MRLSSVPDLVTGHASMDQILANLADAVPDTFTDVSGEEAELPGEIDDVMQVKYQSCVKEHMSHCHTQKKIFTKRRV